MQIDRITFTCDRSRRGRRIPARIEENNTMASIEEPVTVGLLYSQTGETAVIEVAQRQGALLAVSELNAEGGLLGQPVTVLDSNPMSVPSRFRDSAERLLSQGADALFGCYMSSTRKAVLPVIDRRRALLFYPTVYEGFEYLEGCVYSGAAPNQNARMLADFLCEAYEPRFFFVGSNYVFPYESNRIMRDLFANRGASVVDEIYIPLIPSKEDIAEAIEKIRKAGPVVVFSTVVGQGAVDFYRAYDAAGFDRSVQPIASLTFGEPECLAAGVDACVGNIKAAPYFSVVRSPANQRFVTAYRSKFGAEQPVSAEVEAAYFQVKMYGEAVKRAGTTDRAAILKILPTFTFEAPQGTVRIDPVTHHTYLWPRIGIVGADGAFEIVRQTSEPEPPEPYLVEHDDPASLARVEEGWD
ncbi:transporter substrate-binding domain-containing protein [Salipiger aestuarii]|uniref:transporter substrate-binding domain-containing protein n=1 Tax=Salipiger aestuarii TaxID=568098 RepID=UPI001CC2F65F|nr:transporter substrate-binding domain-containing protein [Salipiger aestuarii]